MTTQITAFQITPHNTYGTISLHVSDDSCLTSLQEAVGGWVEVVSLASGPHQSLDMWVDEEGIPKNKPVNMLATMVASELRGGTSLLPFTLGTAVFTSADDAGATRSLSAEQITQLETLARAITA